MESFIILFLIVIINIYIYFLNYLSGKQGLTIPFKGNKKYTGLVGEEGVLYRIPCGKFSVELNQINQNEISLYYSKGSIIPLSKYDFLKLSPPSNSKIFSCSGHYLLIKSNKINKDNYKRSIEDSNNKDQDKLVPFDLNIFISYENNKENINIAFISFFVSLILSLIFFNYLNIYLSLVPTVMLFWYLNFETKFNNFNK